MRTRPDSFSAAVRQFRELTAAVTDGDATRARVLADAQRRQRARLRLRRVGVPLGLLLTFGSAAIAATEAARQPPAALVLDAPVPQSEAPDFQRPFLPRRTIPSIPPTVPALAEPGGPSDAEADAYGAAHAAHFVAEQPARALLAWNDYLRLYPHGWFEPEARFNRAICLIRLRRFEQAAKGLSPFAAGRFGSYRRAEAQQLLDWMAAATPAPALSGAGGR